MMMGSDRSCSALLVPTGIKYMLIWIYGAADRFFRLPFSKLGMG